MLVTRGQIRELRESAQQEEDAELAETCRRALAGWPEAWEECESVILARYRVASDLAAVLGEDE